MGTKHSMPTQGRKVVGARLPVCGAAVGQSRDGIFRAAWSFFLIQNSLLFLEKLRSTELGGWACRVCSNGRLTLGFVWHVPWPEQPLGQYAMAVVARVAAIMILENMI